MHELHITSDMKFVLDTSVFISAMLSPSGASAELLRLIMRGEAQAIGSTALLLEYEAVARRDALLSAVWTAEEIGVVLDALTLRLEPVEINYYWRPQLRDANDEFVLDTAANGKARWIVTFNGRDFLPAAAQFGIEVLDPATALRRIRHARNQ
jgi:putative PIN family toxin of toxin-antitoxin system